MKKFYLKPSLIKRAARGLISCVTAIMLISSFCVRASADDNVSSGSTAGLVQSPDSISTAIVHDHDTCCYSYREVSCGGTWNNGYDEDGNPVHWCSNWDSDKKVETTTLGALHGSEKYLPGHIDKSTSPKHQSFYANVATCGYRNFGTIKIERLIKNDGIYLNASWKATPGLYDCMTDTFLRWEGSTSQPAPLSLKVTQRKKYHLLFSYVDRVTNKQTTQHVYYTDISLPLKLGFYSDGELLYEKEYEYGKMPEKQDIPVKTGYDFAGYAHEGELWFDEKGEPAEGCDPNAEESEIRLDAVWEAKHFTIAYGPDKDKDGEGDIVAEVIYDAAYDDGDVSGMEKTGYIFKGYTLSENRIFDERGKAVSEKWIWDIPCTEERKLSLSADYSPKTYELNCAGKIYTVTYDAPFEEKVKINKPPTGYLFDGYYLGEEKIFDSEGAAAFKTWTKDLKQRTTLYPEYTAKKYRINCSGNEYEVTFDSPYGAVKIPEKKTGYIFKAYSLSGNIIFDAKGNPAEELWKWDTEDSVSLDEVFEPKKYRIYYGDDEYVMTFGEKLPDVSPAPGFTGYLFDGFEFEGEKIYDGNGKAVIEKWLFDTEDGAEMIACFEPKDYRIRCGSKEEEVTYDQPYQDIEPDYEKKGYIFKGYSISGDSVYDEDGRAVSGKWKWDIPDGYELEPELEAKKYKIECDGESYTVTFDEPYDDIHLPVPDVGDDEEFGGYKIDGEIIFDEDGEPASDTWKWDIPDGTVLEPVIKKKQVTPTPVPEGDGEKSGASSNNIPKDPVPSVEVTPKTTPTQKATPTPASESGDAGTSDNKKKKKKSSSGGGSSNSDKDDDRGDKTGNGNEIGITPAPVPVPVPVASLSADMLPFPSGDAVSGNITVKGNKNKKGIDGSEKKTTDDTDDPISKNSVSVNGKKTKSVSSDEQDEGRIVDPEETQTDNIKLLSSPDNGGSINGGDDSGRGNGISGGKAVRTAAAVGGIGAVSAGLIYALQALFVYLFAMAGVCSVSPEGKRKEVGKVAVTGKRGRLHVEIGKKLLDLCGAGRVELVFPKPFVWRYRNRPLEVEVAGRSFVTVLANKVEAR
ncbi:MAG: hypothetical protein K5987_09525 [Lachnospiraceae bacterium]|nr:hypothetical protein [Lachnospiraceae bacterium]